MSRLLSEKRAQREREEYFALKEHVMLLEKQVKKMDSTIRDLKRAKQDSSLYDALSAKCEYLEQHVSGLRTSNSRLVERLGDSLAEQRRGERANEMRKSQMISERDALISELRSLRAQERQASLSQTSTPAHSPMGVEAEAEGEVGSPAPPTVCVKVSLVSETEEAEAAEGEVDVHRETETESAPVVPGSPSPQCPAVCAPLTPSRTPLRTKPPLSPAQRQIDREAERVGPADIQREREAALDREVARASAAACVREQEQERQMMYAALARMTNPVAVVPPSPYTATPKTIKEEVEDGRVGESDTSGDLVVGDLAEFTTEPETEVEGEREREDECDALPGMSNESGMCEGEGEGEGVDSMSPDVSLSIEGVNSSADSNSSGMLFPVGSHLTLSTASEHNRVLSICRGDSGDSGKGDYTSEATRSRLGATDSAPMLSADGSTDLSDSEGTDSEAEREREGSDYEGVGEDAPAHVTPADTHAPLGYGDEYLARSDTVLALIPKQVEAEAEAEAVVASPEVPSVTRLSICEGVGGSTDSLSSSSSSSSNTFTPDTSPDTSTDSSSECAADEAEWNASRGCGVSDQARMSTSDLETESTDIPPPPADTDIIDTSGMSPTECVLSTVHHAAVTRRAASRISLSLSQLEAMEGHDDTQTQGEGEREEESPLRCAEAEARALEHDHSPFETPTEGEGGEREVGQAETEAETDAALSTPVHLPGWVLSELASRDAALAKLHLELAESRSALLARLAYGDARCSDLNDRLRRQRKKALSGLLTRSTTNLALSAVNPTTADSPLPSPEGEAEGEGEGFPSEEVAAAEQDCQRERERADHLDAENTRLRAIVKEERGERARTVSFLQNYLSSVSGMGTGLADTLSKALAVTPQEYATAATGTWEEDARDAQREGTRPDVMACLTAYAAKIDEERERLAELAKEGERARDAEVRDLVAEHRVQREAWEAEAVEWANRLSTQEGINAQQAEAAAQAAAEAAAVSADQQAVMEAQREENAALTKQVERLKQRLASTEVFGHGGASMKAVQGRHASDRYQAQRRKEANKDRVTTSAAVAKRDARIKDLSAEVRMYKRKLQQMSAAQPSPRQSLSASGRLSSPMASRQTGPRVGHAASPRAMASRTRKM
ncbi:hypothetical protein KIPB_002308 [Kipferlia bialata]|uniref:Uncharacterized protein n=1 Tax=Kipferlia bialata TaxID=797122 RepID=A0A9K3CQK2_9EUKA|nr:hypothetical protein KIPB_002308 [Kipferlia bialata]|eukprot:g2308.t1